jgi:hypothetical protein
MAVKAYHMVAVALILATYHSCWAYKVEKFSLLMPNVKPYRVSTNHVTIIVTVMWHIVCIRLTGCCSGYFRPGVPKLCHRETTVIGHWMRGMVMFSDFVKKSNLLDAFLYLSDISQPPVRLTVMWHDIIIPFSNILPSSNDKTKSKTLYGVSQAPWYPIARWTNKGWVSSLVVALYWHVFKANEDFDTRNILYKIGLCVWYALAVRLLPPSNAEVNSHCAHVIILRLKS